MNFIGEISKEEFEKDKSKYKNNDFFIIQNDKSIQCYLFNASSEEQYVLLSSEEKKQEEEEQNESN